MNQVTIKNDFITLEVLDYGAIIQRIIVKNKKGMETNVVFGFEDPRKYLQDIYFLGACIGRFAGRISSGGFSLNGTTYPLHTEKGVHLHGGKKGFGKRTWIIEEIDYGKDPFIKLSYLSEEMEEGYPGNLRAFVKYKLVDNALHIIHEATTDKTTILNMTNHSYFKLDDENQINDYHLRLNCAEVLETYDNLLPTTKIVPVANTRFDFLTEKKMGEVRLDTSFVIAENTGEVAQVYSAKSGILVRVGTNQPALVVYTPPSFPAICFEAQNYPDAPNIRSFPSCLLKPGETYSNTAVFEFDLVI